MKIIVFSINPIFPDVVTGGASKHLYHITRSLGEEGHAVEVLCAQSQADSTSFEWAKNVQVLPILPFRLPFPQPYAISGADLGLIVERVSHYLQAADRFYIHDGEFLLPDVYAHIPTVTSFRDNIYPESILGSFIGKADDVICISQFSSDVIRATSGRFYPGLNERIHLVNNGIDFDVFKPVPFVRLAQRLNVDPQRDIILLHPHRPEPGKGLPETIQLVTRLVHQHGMRQVKVLIPEWIESMVSGGDASFYQQMLHLMDTLGVQDHCVFIPWIPQEEMPALYSLGRVTLCLGNFVETFGNVAYESLACGTPSIVARVGVHRTLLPDHLIDKVDYGDIDGAVDCVLSILAGDDEKQSASLTYLKKHLDYQSQVDAYREIITRCQKREPLQFSPPQPVPGQKYCLAPWCYLAGERIYNDFRREYIYDPDLVAMLRETTSFDRGDAAHQSISDQNWQTWLEKTLIVPVELIE